MLEFIFFVFLEKKLFRFFFNLLSEIDLPLLLDLAKDTDRSLLLFSLAEIQPNLDLKEMVFFMHSSYQEPWVMLIIKSTVWIVA
jgi:hypothetical protein